MNDIDILPILDQPIRALAALIRGSTAPSASVLRAVVATLGQEVDLKNWLGDPDRQTVRGPTDVGGRATGNALDGRVAEYVDLLSDFIVASASVRGQRALLRAIVIALIEALKTEDQIARAARRRHGGAGAPRTMTLMINEDRVESLRKLFEVVRDGRHEPLTFRFLEDGAEVLVLHLQEQLATTAGSLERDGISRT